LGSYAFAPQSVIAPLGGLDVVWNTITAPLTLGETLTKSLFCGCVVITGGAIMTSLVGSHDSGDYTADVMQSIIIRPAVLVYLLAFGAWLLFNVLVLIPRSAAPKGQPWTPGDRLRGLSLGMTAGSISGNMFCVKAFVEVVQDSIVRGTGEAWATWIPYVLLLGAVFFAVSNLYFLTKAMREYEALFMGAVFEGSLIISACISGAVVFCEMERLQSWQIGLYWAAILALVGGIVLVCKGSKPAAEAEESALAGEQASEEPAEAEKSAASACGAEKSLQAQKSASSTCASEKGLQDGVGSDWYPEDCELNDGFAPQSGKAVLAGADAAEIEDGVALQFVAVAKQTASCVCPSCAYDAELEDCISKQSDPMPCSRPVLTGVQPSLAAASSWRQRLEEGSPSPDISRL